jgi:hypothetical protein
MLLPGEMAVPSACSFLLLLHRRIPVLGRRIISSMPGGHKERVKEGKYGESSTYSCMKWNNETC